MKDWKFFVCFLLLIVTLCLLVLFLCRALMDCLVLPIQNKLEEWRKITHALEREHAKGTSKITKQILFSLFPKTSISFHMDVTQ